MCIEHGPQRVRLGRRSIKRGSKPLRGNVGIELSLQRSGRYAQMLQNPGSRLFIKALSRLYRANRCLNLSGRVILGDHDTRDHYVLCSCGQRGKKKTEQQSSGGLCQSVMAKKCTYFHCLGIRRYAM